MKINRLLLAGMIGLLANIALGQQADSPKPQKPAKFRVSQGVMARNAIYTPPPLYPQEAKSRGVQGDVIIEATIDREGKIANLKVVKGDPLLVPAALDTVKQWKYKPLTLKGEPVEVETTILIRFHI